LSNEEFLAARPCYPKKLLAAVKAADETWKKSGGGSVTTARWSGNGKLWYTPSTVDEILDAVRGTNSYKLVGGNTSSGVYKSNVSNPSTLIYLGNIPELHGISTSLDNPKGIHFGGTVTLSNAIAAMENILTTESKSSSASPKIQHIEMLVEHMRKIAGQHVRGVGTLSGNLAMVHRFGFHSDLATILMTAEATVTCFVKEEKGGSGSGSGSGSMKCLTLRLEEFFALKTLDVLIVGIDIPWCNVQAAQTTLMKTFKVALRPQNSHALVNFGAKVTLKKESTTLKYIVTSAIVVYGAVNDNHPIRVNSVEDMLIGRVCGEEQKAQDGKLLLQVAKDVLIAHTPNTLNSSTFASSDEASEEGVSIVENTKDDKDQKDQKEDTNDTVHDIHRVAHRRRLVVNFLIKFLDILDTYGITGNDDNNDGNQSSETKFTVAGSPAGYRRAVSKGTQILPGMIRTEDTDDWYEHLPISLPVPKLTARLSASGEAKFTADMQLPSRTAYSSFVQAYKVGRVVVNVRSEKAEQMPGVYQILTFSDIPGENNGSCTSPERLLIDFNGAPVHYSGEPCAIVVADTPQHARQAAQQVQVVYAPKPPPTPSTSTNASSSESKTNVVAYGNPAFHVKDAMRQGKFMKRSEAAAHLERHDHGCSNIDNAFLQFQSDEQCIEIEGNLRCGSQKHFPIETQTALAIPDEGGKMVVWSSMQYPAGVQTSVARCIYKEGSEADRTLVTAKCRRVGGGFGAKLSRHTPVACAAAVAAVCTRRPVLFALSRNTDMEMTGGRGDVVGTYKATVDKTTGHLRVLKVYILLDCGWSPDISSFCVMALARAIEQTYYVPELDIDVFPVFTQTASRTAMRGPSEIEASFIAETIIAHAATVCGKTQDELREINFFPEAKLVNVDGTIIPASEWTIPRLWSELKTTSDYEARRSACSEFNAENAGRMYRGIACTVVKYAVGASYRSALVNIHSDGSIQLTHSGTEMGQGINTKVAQAAAYVLSKIIDTEEEKRNGKERTGNSNYYPSSVKNLAAGTLLRRVQISDTSTEK